MLSCCCSRVASCCGVNRRTLRRRKPPTSGWSGDTRLYRNIKAGIREYQFREREQDFSRAKDGELLFETAHPSAFGVDHFAESRVGFFFKDTEEFGLYGFFAGNDDDVYHSYYRTDRTFQKEEVLLHE
ncbi:hypothetical protein [Bradyrhizobium sp. JYMT SZCCT0428]|uniref:hypothetical protein n=1 Tax=Bradyrhizobium sp. JYMT SZCCT0428 TaxID=2807673 RepID=UPI001BA60981|nr:hypothetical protein [Bradyrhizobium sp. JYMT SZCCT0428]MBR1154275.1 hypothetical protein [Bradyrhizobium sp. JYMT SZCCT0428]